MQQDIFKVVAKIKLYTACERYFWQENHQMLVVYVHGPGQP